MPTYGRKLNVDTNSQITYRRPLTFMKGLLYYFQK